MPGFLRVCRGDSQRALGATALCLSLSRGRGASAPGLCRWRGYFRETGHSRDAAALSSLVILIRSTIKFILRSSKNRLTRNLAVAKWEPCWVSLQTSAHILQNLLLWWNFSATLRGCAFFCTVDAATQHINQNQLMPLYFPSSEAVPNLNSPDQGRRPGTGDARVNHSACCSTIAQSRCMAGAGCCNAKPVECFGILDAQ